MFLTKQIKILLVLSLIFIIFSVQLTPARAALEQLSNDNGTAEGFNGDWQAGDRVGAVLTPNPAWSYPVKVNSVEFMLHRFTGAANSATVRLHVYSLVGGRPGTLLGSSALTTINTFYPNWTSIDLASANIMLPSADPFMVAMEYLAGTSGTTPSTLTDSQNNITPGKNFYSLDGGDTWKEHYDFWVDPQNVGYNMFRATIDNAPQPAPETKIYLPSIVKNWTPPPPPPPPPADNIPCLLVLAQRLSVPGGFKILLGCVNNPDVNVEWQYDPKTGAVNGFYLTSKNNQGAVNYEAWVEIQRDQFGRIGTYTGTISGEDFPTFHETVTNHYDEFGKVERADVTKVYSTSGFTYTMDLGPCWQGDSWSGYRVQVWGQGYNGDEFVVGTCS